MPTVSIFGPRAQKVGCADSAVRSVAFGAGHPANIVLDVTQQRRSGWKYQERAESPAQRFCIAHSIRLLRLTSR
jgi:hypothetical protein